jgi:hypothetical protein
MDQTLPVRQHAANLTQVREATARSKRAVNANGGTVAAEDICHLQRAAHG